MAHRTIRIRLLVAASALAFAVAVGCDKKAEPTSMNFDPKGMYGKDQDKQKAATAGGQHEVLSACMKCHPVAGSASGKKSNPDLAQLTGEKKSKDWIMAYAKDPKSKNPESKMPPQAMLGDEALGKIADYLLTLK